MANVNDDDQLILFSDSDDEIEYEEEEVQIAGKTFIIKSLPEQIPLEILAKLADKKIEISGRCPWPGSLLLGTYLNHEKYGRHLIENKNVIELGTGCGILGFSIAAHVNKIELTDNDVFALNLVEKNININLAIDNFSSNNGTTPTVEKLSWANENDLKKYNLKNVKYDVVIAADVCYKEEIVNPLFITARQLSKPNAKFILCHVPRGTTNGNGNSLVTNEIVCKYAEKNEFKIMNKIDINDELITISPKECVEGVGCKNGCIYVFQKEECSQKK